VPDIYHGTELWDLSLVDPDNRRPVDYESRRRHLESMDEADPAELLEQWQDGRIKMFVIRKLLQFRRDNPELYKPVPEDPDLVATERLLNDDSLQRGDIVSTKKGMFVYQGRPDQPRREQDFVPIAPKATR
jgi:hypothetical protein